MNPISSHLEIELNDRLNVIGSQNSNAVWQIHLNWVAFQNLRVSCNYLLDEFVLDPNIQENKEHGDAYSMKLDLNILNSKKLFNFSIFFKNKNWNIYI